MKKTKKQKISRKVAENRPGFKHALTVAAAVASLGTSLGVDVEKTFAAAFDAFRPAEQQGAFQEKQDSFDHKLPASQQKGDAGFYKENAGQQKGLPAVQHKDDAFTVKRGADQHKGDANHIKGESRQLKYENQGATFVKLHNRKLTNGNTFIVIDGKAFTRTPGGKQTPAADGIYEFQDGQKIILQGGKIK